MLKAVIFDLNGIFIQSEKLSDRFARDFGIATEKFMPKLKEIMQMVRKPNAEGAFSYWQPALKDWNVNLNEQGFWDYWFNGEIVSEYMVGLAQELRDKGIRVFILSNNFKERADFYTNYPWIKSVVDKTYFSWQTGFVKPDPQAWQIILSENDLRPEECMYFDDQENNVAVAASLGIKAYLFKNETDLKEKIELNIVL